MTSHLKIDGGINPNTTMSELNSIFAFEKASRDIERFARFSQSEEANLDKLEEVIKLSITAIESAELPPHLPNEIAELVKAANVFIWKGYLELVQAARVVHAHNEQLEQQDDEPSNPKSEDNNQPA